MHCSLGPRSARRASRDRLSFLFRSRGLGPATAIGCHWGFPGCGKRCRASRPCLDSANCTKNCRYGQSAGSVGDARETGVDDASCALPASRIILRNSLRCSDANSLAELIGRPRPLSGSVRNTVSILLMSRTQSWFQTFGQQMVSIPAPPVMNKHPDWSFRR